MNNPAFTEREMYLARHSVFNMLRYRWGGRSPVGYLGIPLRGLVLALDAQCRRDYGEGFIGPKRGKYVVDFRETPPGWPAVVPPGEAFHFTNLVVRRRRLGRRPKYGPDSKEATFTRTQEEYKASQNV
jgi:hypothetical protein